MHAFDALAEFAENFTQSISLAWNARRKAAFIGYHKKEMTMDNSNGATGATTTPADTARRIKEAAGQAIDRGRQAAMSKVQEGADRVRTTAYTTSEALRRAAVDVEQDNSLVGSGLRRVADLLESTTERLGTGDLNQIVDQLNGFARRQPALFIGASLALGFVIARLGKTALENASGQQSPMENEYAPDVTPGL